MRKFGFALSVGLLMVSSLGWAADPTVAGTTLVGTHPSYGTNFSGFWRTGGDYAVLTDNYHSYINAPNQAGGVYVRNANADVAVFLREQIYLQQDTYTNGWFIANGWAAFNNPLISYAGISSYGDMSLVGKSYIYGDMRVDGPSTFYGSTSLAGNTSLSGVTDFFGKTTVRGGLTVENSPDSGSGITVRQTGFNGTYAIALNGTDASLWADGDIWARQGYKPGGGVWKSFSDRRVKKDIVDFRSGLADIEQVHPVRFKYNGLAGTVNSDKEYVGVIAQELERVAPYMVSSQKKKLYPTDAVPADIKEVDASALTYMLINAVQELSQQNKEMKKALCQALPSAAACGNISKKLARK